MLNGYDCFYFGGGEDGAMKTNKTNITIDGDNFNFYFEKSGSNKGAGINGEKDDKVLLRVVCWLRLVPMISIGALQYVKYYRLLLRAGRSWMIARCC